MSLRKALKEVGGRTIIDIDGETSYYGGARYNVENDILEGSQRSLLQVIGVDTDSFIHLDGTWKIAHLACIRPFSGVVLY